ncbi:MAG: DUF1919 domain-containing protein [Lachnospiraceae bacterium]|nr:DUF1919 domain-containing protein [Lachnospiraceae bacterium]
MRAVRASVIIPVYNAEKTIRKCVESLAFGSTKDVEIILVEDHSNDNSYVICQQLKEDNEQVKCFRNSENRGVSYSRNFGLDMAQGEWIFFVDSDDWVSGRFVDIMLNSATQHPMQLTVCGYLLVDKASGIKTRYCFNEGSLAECEDLFMMADRIMLQQIWNKAFRSDIIKKEGLRFDENQSMGEDFQFVLDYLEAGKIGKCRIINELLYYYTRSGQQSLMSQFGLVENQYEFKRLEKMMELCSERDPGVQQKYERAIENLKYNYMYQAVHSSKTKEDKLRFIENIMHDGRAESHYRNHSALLKKEQLAQKINDAKQLPERAKGRKLRKNRDAIADRMKSQFAAKNVSIISQNCIAGVFYHDMGEQFLTPTVNLFFKEPDFVRFALNLEYYLSCELRMTWGEEYPIGYLDDVAVYFMHYDTCSEAKTVWERRKERVNFEKIMILATDMEGFTDDVYEEWRTIPYPKILFSAVNREDPDTVYYPEYKDKECVPDLIPGREFYKDGRLLNLVNQVGA